MYKILNDHHMKLEFGFCGALINLDQLKAFNRVFHHNLETQF